MSWPWPLQRGSPPTRPTTPPHGRFSAPLSLPGRLHALALIDKNLILPPWPYKAWFPSPESLAGPLTFLISCSCLLLWCCFGRGQGGHGEWKHLAGWAFSAPCPVSPQAPALACPCCSWLLTQGAAEGLPVGAESSDGPFFCWKGPASSPHPLVPFLGAVARKLVPTSLPLPRRADAGVRKVLGDGRQGEFVVRGWDDVLNRGLCRSFPGRRGAPLGAASCCGSAAPALAAKSVLPGQRWPCARSPPADCTQAAAASLPYGSR